MNAFVNAVANVSNQARTENDMKAFKSTTDANVDLFYKIGASRGKNILTEFRAAFTESEELALRIAQWARDIRGGAGERQLFRDILSWLATVHPDAAKKLMNKVPELGRWDDVLIDLPAELKTYTFQLIRNALYSENPGLAAKWMPRKGALAAELRNFLVLSPKAYRKLLVNKTNVVETQMCAKDWDNINYSHVPSVASARYKKAFGRHSEKYAEYIQKLVKGDKSVKVNASVVYPYDVLKGMVTKYGHMNLSALDLEHIKAQWEALPNYVGDASILPMVDVSGSMTAPVNKNGMTALEVAVGLGLYLADKNKGAFKDTFLTFSADPELLHLKGDIIQKIAQMASSHWTMNTNLDRAIQKVLDTALMNRVPAADMPKMLLILSDMQFDSSYIHWDASAIEMIKYRYKNAGYEMPQIVFWNINSYANVPVKHDQRGVALVSGFSPSIAKAVLEADLEEFTPYGIMLKTIMKDRYAL